MNFTITPAAEADIVAHNEYLLEQLAYDAAERISVALGDRVRAMRPIVISYRLRGGHRLSARASAILCGRSATGVRSSHVCHSRSISGNGFP